MTSFTPAAQSASNRLWSTCGSTSVAAQAAPSLRYICAARPRACLMDADEYQAYLDGGEYEYHGGFFDVSPIVLEAPYDDDWYLVVDSYQ